MSPKEIGLTPEKVAEIRAKKTLQVKEGVATLKKELPERTLGSREFQKRVVDILSDLSDLL